MPSRSQALVNVSVIVVAVSAILLLLFRLFSFVFYCETMARDSVATMWEKLFTAK